MRRQPGLQCQVFIPKDAKQAFVDECRLYGATVTLVDGLITEAGKVATEMGKLHDWYNVATLREPCRIEGKKTMGYELAEQFGWRLPDWIVYPTGGGTGLIGMWKAFDEMEAIGWLVPGRRPRMVSVQASGCAPIVRAFEAGTEKAEPWENAHTSADGLRVPRAIGDFLMLRVLRESGGTGIAVDDARDAGRHARSWRAGRRQCGPRGRGVSGGGPASRRRRPDSAARDGRLLQHRRGAEVLRHAPSVSAGTGTPVLAVTYSPNEMPIARAVPSRS